MATIEGEGLTAQIIHNMYGLVLDMRDNAANYKTRLVAGQSVASVRVLMLADADRYKERLQLITDVASRNLAKVTAALQARGLTVAQMVNDRDAGVAAADHTLAADLSTTTAINAEADFILANVPAYERLW